MIGMITSETYRVLCLDKEELPQVMDQCLDNCLRTKQNSKRWIRWLGCISWIRKKQERKQGKAYLQCLTTMEILMGRAKSANESFALERDVQDKFDRVLRTNDRYIARHEDRSGKRIPRIVERLRPHFEACREAFGTQQFDGVEEPRLNPTEMLKLSSLLSDWTKQRAQFYIPLHIRELLSQEGFKEHQSVREAYFNGLKALPDAAERNLYIDKVCALEVGKSTEELTHFIEGLPLERDRDELNKLLTARNQVTVELDVWTAAVDRYQARVEDSILRLQETSLEVERLSQEITSLSPVYARMLLRNSRGGGQTAIQALFYKWAVRDRLPVETFFKHPTCVEVMKTFFVDSHAAVERELSNGDHAFQSAKGAIPTLKMGNVDTPWVSIPWEQIFVSHQYCRESVKALNTKLDIEGEMQWMYLPGRGLTNQKPTDWRDSFDEMEEFCEEEVILRDGQEPCWDYNMMVSYEEGCEGPAFSGTHSYLKLRIPVEGSVQEEDGQRKCTMKVYYIGVFSNPGFTNEEYEKPHKKLQFIHLLNQKSTLEFFNTDMNCFYRNSHYAKLDQPIRLEGEAQQRFVKVIKDYEKSQWDGEDEKIEEAARRFFCTPSTNCSEIVSEVYEGRDSEGNPIGILPRKVYLHQFFENGGMPAGAFKRIHNLPRGPKDIAMFAIGGLVFGAPLNDIPENLEFNSTYSMRLYIALQNQIQQMGTNS